MSVHAEFHYHTVPDFEQSEIQGRKIFKDKVYVTLRIVGNRNQIFSREKRDADEIEYPEAWKRFKLNGAEGTTGTPLSNLPRMSPAMIAELNASHVRCVEDLAQLDDAAMMNIRGGRTLTTMAKQYLALGDALANDLKSVVTPSVVKESDDPVDVDALSKAPDVVPKQRGRPRKASPVDSIGDDDDP